MNSSLLADIRLELERFTRAERQVADWLLANSRQAVDMSLSDVARACQVSDPTVVRFCRTLGLDGFRDLRTQLIAALQKPQSYLHQDVSAADTPQGASLKVLESAIFALVELRESIASKPLEPALEALRQARQIVFTGLGASGHVAQDAQHKFFRLGIPCTTALDSQTIIQQASIAMPADVYITISHTGNWPELVTGMTLARARGATVIAVTDRASKLAEVSSLIFHCHPPEDTNLYTPMSSRLAQLTLLDALQVCLAISMGARAESNLELTKDSLSLAVDSVAQ